MADRTLRNTTQTMEQRERQKRWLPRLNQELAVRVNGLLMEMWLARLRVVDRARSAPTQAVPARMPAAVGPRMYRHVNL